MLEHEGASEPEHDALHESIDSATDELSELLRDPEANADAIAAKKKELAELSAQLPPDSMEMVAQGLVEEGSHIVKDEAATRLDMEAQLHDILAAVEKGVQPVPVVEHTGELTETDKKLRTERLSALIGEARMFVATFQTVLGEADVLEDVSFRNDVWNRLQGIAETALGRLSLSLELERGIPTGIFRPNAEEVTPDMVDGYIHDVQGGMVLLERVRANITAHKEIH